MNLLTIRKCYYKISVKLIFPRQDTCSSERASIIINLIYTNLQETHFSTLNNLQTPISDIRFSQGEALK